MKQNKFAVGQLVRVYQGDEIAECAVIECHADGTMNVDYLGAVHLVHQKQCRRLIAKPRRRIWVNEYMGNQFNVFNSKEIADKHAYPERISCTEYIEVKKAKK